KRHKRARELSVLLLIVVLAVMPGARDALVPMAAALAVFCIGFHVLEALQPSVGWRVAAPHYESLALGRYNTSQPPGVFPGGLVGGILAGRGLTQWVLWTGAALALLWLLTARGFKDKY